MKEKKSEENKNIEKANQDEKLEPCTTPHSAEASRPDEDEEACDEGVK